MIMLGVYNARAVGSGFDFRLLVAASNMTDASFKMRKWMEENHPSKASQANITAYHQKKGGIQTAILV